MDNQAKTLFLFYDPEGGELPLAFSKNHKSEMIAQYENWINKSQAIFFLEYSKMTMSDVDGLRAKVRETGSEIHVVKNTLLGKAFAEAGIPVNEKLIDGTTLAGFAYQDVAALAKVLKESTAKSEIFSVKGGYLGKEEVSVAQIKALAELPPLPVMRAKLLGTLLAPASQLVRTLAEPARSVAAVIKAHSEQESAPVAA